MLYLLTMLILCFSIFFTVQHFFYQNNSVKNILYTLAFFVIEYYLFSALFLFIDYYSVAYVLVCCLITNIILCVVIRRKYNSIFNNRKYIFKSDLLFIVLMILMLPFVSKKNENFDLHDTGQYYEKAIQLADDGPQKANLLPEYGMYTEDVSQDLLEMAQTLPKDWTIINGQLQYTYHGIPTWVTFITLFIKIFGVYTSLISLTFFYLIACFSLYYAIGNICKQNFCKYLSIPLFGFLPIILFLAKTTLTELPFIAMLLFGICLISSPDIREKYLSIIPFGLLGFLHVSVILYVPIFFIALLILSLYKNLKYGVINICTIMMYIASLGYCAVVSPFYTKNQLGSIPFFNTMKLSMAVIIITAGCLLLIAIQCLVIKSKSFRNLLMYIGHFLSPKLPVLFRIAALLLIAITLYQAYRLGFTDTYNVGGGSWTRRKYYSNQGFISLTRLNIISIVMATGYISIPYIFYRLFSKKTQWNFYEKFYGILLLYGLSIYLVLRFSIPDTPYNYFVSRYYATFIVPICAILMAVLIKTKWQFIFISIFAIITALPFSLFLMNTRESDGQNDFLKSVMEIIPTESVVLVDNSDFICNNCVFALRELNQNYVFSLQSKESIEAQEAEKEIFVFTTQPINDENYTVRYESEVQTNRDTLTYDPTIIYPLTNTYRTYDIYIYEYCG